MAKGRSVLHAGRTFELRNAQSGVSLLEEKYLQDSRGGEKDGGAIFFCSIGVMLGRVLAVDAALGFPEFPVVKIFRLFA
jgi:hypothetical protein